MNNKPFAVFLIICFMFSLFSFPACADEATAVYLDISDLHTPEKNEEFTLPVKALNNSDIYSYKLIISFEKEHLKAIDIKGNSGGIEVIKEIDNNNGEITYLYCVNDKSLSDNILANITFKVIDVGFADITIERDSKFLRKPGEDDKTGDVDIEIDWNFGSDYQNKVELKVGAVASPKFVSENNKTIFPYTLKVWLENDDKDAVIYYSTSSNREPNERYYKNEPIVLSSTTTIYAVAVKNGIYSKTVSKRYSRESGSGGGGYSPTIAPVTTTTPNNAQTPNQPQKYKDIENHWSKPHFEKLIEKGIISGYEDDTIRPDNQITRAEAAKIITLAINLTPSDDTELDFSDAGEIADWAKGYIKTAVEKGIITGYEDNTFKPNQLVTRSELIVLAVRAFKLTEGNLDEIAFSDTADIPSWAAASIAAVVKLGIVSGYGDNTFKPYNYVTRAEASKIISEGMELL